MSYTIDRPLQDETNVLFTYLNSACIESAVYHTKLNDLFISFRDGATYRYHGVPHKDFVNLQRSISAGTYFNDNIKECFESEVFC